MPTKLIPFDVVDFLDSEESIAAYLNEAITSGDQDFFLAALGDVARARGMAKVSEASGMSRESLYKALRAGANPAYSTVSRVLSALGVHLVAVPGG